MNTVLLNELRALILKHAAPDAKASQLIPNLLLGARSAPTVPCQIVVEPVFSLIVQGSKRIQLGQQTFDYHAGQYLVVSVDLPVDAHVFQATPDLPYLGCGMTLRAEAIASLLLQSTGPRPVAADRAGIAINDLSSDLMDAVVRLLRLLDRPEDVPILAAPLEREILWRLMNGPQGSIVRQIGLTDSRMSQIGRAVRWLGSHFADSVRIEDLAEIAGMSVTSLHRHFRIVTSLTPIQYQKQLRLQAARTRLLAMKEDVSEVAFAVGYDSSSQFSREYRRMFGKPPGRDGAELRANPLPAGATSRVV